ncbi:MAG: ATP-binding protein [bacterium]
MSLDGKLLSRARKRIDERRKAEERALEERRRIAFQRDPRIRDLEAGMKAAVLEAVGVALQRGEDPVEAVEAIRDRSLSLQEERALRLVKAGLPGDYLTQRVHCRLCRDTGFVEGEPCRCLRDFYREEQRKELSRSLDLGEQRFERFKLSYYDATPGPGESQSARETMRFTFSYCQRYADNFSLRSENLLFTGKPGLGKTFLSAAIARVVSEKGYSVYYDTSSSIFQKYEQEKFSRSQEDLESARQEIRRMEGCDLLILDDLGTEMNTALVTSSLYTLLNNRLLAARPTIVSSNLTLHELGERYSPAIRSRLEGEYFNLLFVGRDIRLQKSQA